MQKKSSGVFKIDADIGKMDKAEKKFWEVVHEMIPTFPRFGEGVQNYIDSVFPNEGIEKKDLSNSRKVG